MDTLLVAFLSFAGFIVAYNTYGRWLGDKIFNLRDDTPTPAELKNDGMDYCPTRRGIVFGHHFTSIAGTGPIVGPAIAVFWGWLPALIWVLVGSVFIGAVHDFGALVVSMRNEGRSIADVAGREVSKLARLLFLAVLVIELSIVLAVFGLVIALIFAWYPESVLSVWFEVPIAIFIGLFIHKRGGNVLLASVVALALMYLMIWVGTIYPVDITKILNIKLLDSSYANAVVVWTLILFGYCFVASVLPVWVLLQPRDYINSHELFLAMALLVVGLVVASVGGDAQLAASTPAVVPASEVPADAPPMIPFLFIVVACGAVSGFHCMVSSGTSSKQLCRSTHARSVGYGAMLLEAALAVVVILACTSGLGMGLNKKVPQPDGSYEIVAERSADGLVLSGHEAWRSRYNPSVADGHGWSKHTLAAKLGAFIDGGANFLKSIGIPLKFGIGILAVLVASFAATTLDTATRLQRYVLEELGETIGVRPLKNKYVATFIALAIAAVVAIFSGKKPGSGGLSLWPVFGATNQLLAGLALVVIASCVKRSGKASWFITIPAAAMLIIPGWAMLSTMRQWFADERYFIFGFAVIIELLAAALVITALMSWKNSKAISTEC